MAKIVPDTWPLPSELKSRVGSRVGRQRLLNHQGHQLMVLHQLPKAHARDRLPAVFWRSPEGAWRCFPGRDNASTLRDHVEALAKVLEELDDKVESAKSATEFLDVIRLARPLQRYTRNMHAVIAQLRDALPDDADVLAARDRAYELERLAENICDDAENGMQHTIAQHSEEQAALSERIAKETHRLNLLAAVAMPITALGSLLGMNVHNGLEELPPFFTFWPVVAVSVIVGFLIRSRVQKDG
ncbi:MAG: CorA family divalent cation transporter [Sandaracinaceae bacterium]|nr:CorA family divalent cation transporter [Sandaracinaceae bacterium]